MPRIVDHLPERMSYLDRGDPRADGSLPEKQGRIILSGGEFLLEALREPLSLSAGRTPRRRATAARVA